MRPRRSPFEKGMKGTPSNCGGTAMGPQPSAFSSTSGSTKDGIAAGVVARQEGGNGAEMGTGVVVQRAFKLNA